MRTLARILVLAPLLFLLGVILAGCAGSPTTPEEHGVIRCPGRIS